MLQWSWGHWCYCHDVYSHRTSSTPSFIWDFYWDIWENWLKHKSVVPWGFRVTFNYMYQRYKLSGSSNSGICFQPTGSSVPPTPCKCTYFNEALFWSPQIGLAADTSISWPYPHHATGKVTIGHFAICWCPQVTSQCTEHIRYLTWNADILIMKSNLFLLLTSE